MMKIPVRYLVAASVASIVISVAEHYTKHVGGAYLNSLDVPLVFFSLVTMMLVTLFVSVHYLVSKPLSVLTQHILSSPSSGVISESFCVTELSELSKALNTVFKTLPDREQHSIVRERSLKLSAKLFEFSTDGILISDSANTIVTANPAFLNMCGLELSDIVGKNPRMFSTGSRSPEFYSILWDSLSSIGKWAGEIEGIDATGRLYTKHLFIEVVKDSCWKIVNYISTHSESINRREMEENIHYLAYYDSLTGLPNRALLKDRMYQAITSSERNTTEFSILFLDLDRFKYVNDTLGHAVGDELLKLIADRLRSVARNVDTIARIGGDEFVIVLTTTGAKSAAVVASHILEVMQEPIEIRGHTIVTNVSIGIATYTQNGTDIDTLTKNADIAMYSAKRNGRNNFMQFEQQMSSLPNNVFDTEKDIRVGLAGTQFFLEYQPQVDVETGIVFGVEALVRWEHPTKGRIPPTEFIPIAEETGQILYLGERILRDACRVLNELKARSINIVMSVNISIKQLESAAFLPMLTSVVEEFNILPHMLDLEITEGLMLSPNSCMMGKLSEIRDLGVNLSIDDFGTGFSSLSYLQNMPVTQLKIDKSFINNIAVNNGNLAIVKSIHSLCEQFGLDVLAEGVETQEQQNILRGVGCCRMQGHLFSAALSESALHSYLDKSLELS